MVELFECSDKLNTAVEVRSMLPHSSAWLSCSTVWLDQPAYQNQSAGDLVRSLSNGVASSYHSNNSSTLVFALVEFESSSDAYSGLQVTAGNALFHVVVDTDATASQIYRHLVRDKIGRITCMPLNRLNVRRCNEISSLSRKLFSSSDCSALP